MSEDATIVNSIIHGDMRAFKVLVEQHKKLVLHMVGRVLNDPEDREDACQEVFLKVYKNLSKFNCQSKLSTWIATIAYRTAINYMKKSRKASAREAEKLRENYEVADMSTEQKLDSRDIKYYIHEQISKLPLPYRTVLTLFHLQEMNYAEIVEVTGMPEGTVKSYLFRARKLLKERLQALFIKEELL